MGGSLTPKQRGIYLSQTVHIAKTEIQWPYHAMTKLNRPKTRTPTPNRQPGNTRDAVFANHYYSKLKPDGKTEYDGLLVL